MKCVGDLTERSGERNVMILMRNRHWNMDTNDHIMLLRFQDVSFARDCCEMKTIMHQRCLSGSGKWFCSSKNMLTVFCLHFHKSFVENKRKTRRRCCKCVGKMSLINFSRLMSRAFFKFREISKPKIPCEWILSLRGSSLFVSYGFNETEN